MNRLFRSPTAGQTDLALAILRVTIGAVFIAHGAQKLFVFGLAGVAGGFGQMGIPMAGIIGPMVALLEFFGGLALVFGALTRLVSIGLAVNMLGAMMLVHLKAGFFLPAGYEFVFTLLGAAVTLAITGAGRYSVDGLIARRRGDVAGDVRAIRRAA
jgi:putative oxidoreductase